MPDPARPRPPKGIDVRGLRVDLGGRTVVTNANLSVARGELTYLLGRNGAGKSTLLRSICGMVTPSSGSVEISGVPVREIASPARSVGMHLGADVVHPGHTARRHLRAVAAAAGIDPGRVDEVMTLTGVNSYGKRRIGEYSLGMRQRLGIATALLPDAPVLVFDEPLNGLDVEAIVWVRGLLTGLARSGRAVLVASHLLSEVQRSADRVALVHRKTVDGSVPVNVFVGDHPDLESAYLAAITDPTATKAVPA